MILFNRVLAREQKAIPLAYSDTSALRLMVVRLSDMQIYSFIPTLMDRSSESAGAT